MPLFICLLLFVYLPCLLVYFNNGNLPTQARIEELEEELEKERKNRIRAEKARTDLSREVEDMGLRLEEAGGTNSQQSEVNRRREAEIGKLKRELEVANTNHDQEVFNLRKRSNDILAELQEQIELLTKAKAK